MLETPVIEKQDLLFEIRQELESHLKTYQNESAAWSSFEKYSGLNRKTLKGFLTSNRVPYPQTLVNFYKWKFKTEDLNEVVKNLDGKVKQLLASQGYELGTNKKDITSLVCQTPVHLEIYLMTEDGQTVKKSRVKEVYGKSGEDALHDLVMEDVVHLIDGETIIAGSVRSSQDLNYYKQAFKQLLAILPWGKLENNLMDESISLSLGNVVVANKDMQELARAFGDFHKKLCQLHVRGLKTKADERSNIMYNFSYFHSSLEEGAL